MRTCSPPGGCQGCPKAPASQGTENRALLPAQCLAAPWLPHQQLEDQLKFSLLQVKRAGGEQAEGPAASPAGYPCGQPPTCFSSSASARCRFFISTSTWFRACLSFTSSAARSASTRASCSRARRPSCSSRQHLWRVASKHRAIRMQSGHNSSGWSPGTGGQPPASPDHAGGRDEGAGAPRVEGLHTPTFLHAAAELQELQPALQPGQEPPATLPQHPAARDGTGAPQPGTPFCASPPAAPAPRFPPGYPAGPRDSAGERARGPPGRPMWAGGRGGARPGPASASRRHRGPTRRPGGCRRGPAFPGSQGVGYPGVRVAALAAGLRSRVRIAFGGGACPGSGCT